MLLNIYCVLGTPEMQKHLVKVLSEFIQTVGDREGEGMGLVLGRQPRDSRDEGRASQAENKLFREA